MQEINYKQETASFCTDANWYRCFIAANLIAHSFSKFNYAIFNTAFFLTKNLWSRNSVKFKLKLFEKCELCQIWSVLRACNMTRNAWIFSQQDMTEVLYFDMTCTFIDIESKNPLKTRNRNCNTNKGQHCLS